ncbi:hypothetical protein KR222_007193, partial [Zaprionus bogoriensis]
VIPAWTVIQQRINGRENFKRSWAEYQQGFGSYDGDFFLGLNKIHRLTEDGSNELFIYMERFDGTSFYAFYDDFAISGVEDYYRLLLLGQFQGNTDNWFSDHVNAKFTTYDMDND